MLDLAVALDLDNIERKIRAGATSRGIEGSGSPRAPIEPAVSTSPTARVGNPSRVGPTTPISDNHVSSYIPPVSALIL